jgi:hypothetical protein
MATIHNRANIAAESSFVERGLIIILRPQEANK